MALYLSLNTFCVSVLNFNVNTKTHSQKCGSGSELVLVLIFVWGEGADMTDRMEMGNYIILCTATSCMVKIF